jgi:hypothetical protein
MIVEPGTLFSVSYGKKSSDKHVFLVSFWKMSVGYLTTSAQIYWNMLVYVEVSQLYCLQQFNSFFFTDYL